MRKVLLILCLAFFVLGFGWPTIILPYTKYSYKTDDMEMSFTFQINGKVKVESKMGDSKTKQSYKYKVNFKDNAIEIIVSKEEKISLKIDSFYKLSMLSAGDMEISPTNKVAAGVSIGIGAAALLLIVFAPSKKY